MKYEPTFDGTTNDQGFANHPLQHTQYLRIINPTEIDIFIERVEFCIGEEIHEIETYSPCEKISPKSILEIGLYEFNFGDNLGFFIVKDAISNKFKSNKLKLNHQSIPNKELK